MKKVTGKVGQAATFEMKTFWILFGANTLQVAGIYTGTISKVWANGYSIKIRLDCGGYPYSYVARVPVEYVKRVTKKTMPTPVYP